MKSQFLDSLRNAVKYWWVSLIIGILAIVVGIWCVFTPISTLITLSYLFIIVFLISGISEIVFAIANRNSIVGWGWSLASGICELLLGVLLLALPLPIITQMLIFLLGFWIMFRSFWSIGEAFWLQRLEVRGWGWLLALGILSLLFSFLFLFSPVFGSIFIIVFVGVAFISYGVFRIFYGFRLRTLHKEIKDNWEE